MTSPTDPDRWHGYVKILEALPSNAARAAQCLAWQKQASSDWSKGQEASITKIVTSTAYRYRAYDARARKEIGKRLWSTSALAKSLAGDEELFCRWATMYGVAPDA